VTEGDRVVVQGWTSQPLFAPSMGRRAAAQSGMWRSPVHLILAGLTLALVSWLRMTLWSRAASVGISAQGSVVPAAASAWRRAH